MRARLGLWPPTSTLLTAAWVWRVLPWMLCCSRPSCSCDYQVEQRGIVRLIFLLQECRDVNIGIARIVHFRALEVSELGNPMCRKGEFFVVFGSGHFTIKIFVRLIDRIPSLVSTSFLPLFSSKKCSYDPPEPVPTSSFPWIFADSSTRLSTYGFLNCSFSV